MLKKYYFKGHRSWYSVALPLWRNTVLIFNQSKSFFNSRNKHTEHFLTGSRNLREMALLHLVSTLLCLSGTIWWSWIFAYLNQKTNAINFDISKMNICAAFMGYFFNAWIFSIIFLEFSPFNPILANLASFVITFSSVYIFTSVNICNFHLLLYRSEERRVGKD